MMHARQQSREPGDGVSHGVEEQAIYKMRLVSTPTNGRPEMNRNRLSRVLDNVGPKDCLENDTHRIRETCCRVRHFRQKPGNPAGPELTSRYPPFPGASRHHQLREEEKYGQCDETVRRRHGKDDGIFRINEGG